MNKKSIFSLALTMVLFPVACLALVLPPDQSGTISIVGIFDNIFLFIFWPIVVTVIIVVFVFAGLKFLTARGDPSKLGEARKTFIWGIVGVAVIMLSLSIIYIVRAIIGV